MIILVLIRWTSAQNSVHGTERQWYVLRCYFFQITSNCVSTLTTWNSLKINTITNPSWHLIAVFGSFSPGCDIQSDRHIKFESVPRKHRGLILSRGSERRDALGFTIESDQSWPLCDPIWKPLITFRSLNFASLSCVWVVFGEVLRGDSNTLLNENLPDA